MKLPPRPKTFFCKFEENNRSELQDNGYREYKRLYLPPDVADDLIEIWEKFTNAPEEDSKNMSFRKFQLPANRFDIKHLILTTERSQHIGSRHYQQDDGKNHPIYKFIPLPTKEKFAEYASTIYKRMRKYNNYTIFGITKKLENFENNWRANINEKRRDELKKIRMECDYLKASEMINNFMKTPQDDAWILVQYWGLQIEDFVENSLKKCIGCLLQKGGGRECSFALI
ncbi:hypothetical protein FO519_009659, partial [Halicephalobus sp. NKZ332]